MGQFVELLIKDRNNVFVEFEEEEEEEARDTRSKKKKNLKTIVEDSNREGKEKEA